MPRTVLAAILLIVNAAGPVGAVTVAHWKLDEVAGNFVADATGVHHGTAINSPIVAGPNLSSLGGASNLARQFGVAGPVSHILVPDHSDWDLGSQFTLEAWIKADSYNSVSPSGHGGGLISHYQPIGNNRSIDLNLQVDAGFGVSVSSDGLGAGTTQVGIGSVLTTDEWHWIVATFDSGTANLYLDGVFLTSGSGLSTSAFAAATEFTIGAGQDDPASGVPDRVGRSFDGAMDEVRILNVALTQGEVRDRYNSFFIPEPASILLMGLGFVFLAKRRPVTNR